MAVIGNFALKNANNSSLDKHTNYIKYKSNYENKSKTKVSSLKEKNNHQNLNRKG